MSAWVNGPKPYWTMSAPGLCLRWLIVLIGSWPMTVVLCHRGVGEGRRYDVLGDCVHAVAEGVDQEQADQIGANPS